MLSAACANGWLNFDKAMPETLLSIKRAGANIIITYFAKAYAEMLKK
jgi:porphobilinogen synthase